MPLGQIEATDGPARRMLARMRERRTLECQE